jgi:hypothetical protein
MPIRNLVFCFLFGDSIIDWDDGKEDDNAEKGIPANFHEKANKCKQNL